MTIRQYHMYGEINVTLKIDKDVKYIYLPCLTSLKELSKRFLQCTHFDPRCFLFYSNKKQITEEIPLFYTVNNPLKDFTIKCNKVEKKDFQTVNIIFKYLKNKKSIQFQTFKQYINDDDLKILIGQYLSLEPQDIKVKLDKNGKYLVDSDHVIILKAQIQDRDDPVELIFSDKSTVLDLKYLASVYDPKNCSRLYINDRIKDTINKVIVVNKFEKDMNKNKLSFRPYNNKINYKENEQSEIKQTTFDGAPIGRNIIRAIAKETKIKLDEAYHKVLMIESEAGIHIYKVKCTKFVKYLHDPFILLTEVPYLFEIHRGEESTNQEILIDPQYKISQLRRYLSNLPNFAPSCFIKIKNKKNKIIDDQLKVEEAVKPHDKFIIEIEEPHPIEATFRLYDNENKKQTLTIDPSESSFSVIKTFADNFKISPSFIHIFLNGYRVIDNHKFINYYTNGSIYNIASVLYIKVNDYKGKQKRMAFPLNTEFNLLADVCKKKFDINENVKIGFIDISSSNENDHILVYSQWEKKHIFPGPQYIARYQNVKETKSNFMFVDEDMYNKKYGSKSSDPSTTEEIELDILIYTQDGRLGSKVTEKLTEKVINVVKKMLTDESQQNLDSAIFFSSEHELRSDSTIFDVQKIYQNSKDESSVRPKLIVFSTPNIYLYKLPGKSDFQYILVDQSMNLYDFQNQIRKSSQMVIIKYDGEIINNLSQSIVFFNQRKPFMIEYVKNLTYNLIYEGPKETYKIEQIFDETTNIFNVLTKSCSFLNDCEKSSGPPKESKKPSSMPVKSSGKPAYKITQIRVMINSIILSKEMEKELLINNFGLTGDIIITPLQKIGITIQGDNFHFFYFSPNDTIMFIKKSIIKRLEAKEEDAPYYFILKNQVALSDSDLLSECLDEDENFDDLCLDIVPIQDVSKSMFIFPEFNHEFIFSKDIIMYDVKEYFARFYKMEDPDMVELIDQATGEAVDDNDNPIDDQIIVVNFNIEDPKLDSRYTTKIEQFKEDSIELSEDASISDISFKCPFTYKSSKDYDFDLVIGKEDSAKIAKLRIANYLAKLDKDKDDDEQIDPDELMITINNKEVHTQEILFDKYKSSSKSNPSVRFIVNKEVVDLNESNIFLATTKSIIFSSYELF